MASCIGDHWPILDGKLRVFVAVHDDETCGLIIVAPRHIFQETRL